MEVETTAAHAPAPKSMGEWAFSEMTRQSDKDRCVFPDCEADSNSDVMQECVVKRCKNLFHRRCCAVHYEAEPETGFVNMCYQCMEKVRTDSAVNEGIAETESVTFDQTTQRTTSDHASSGTVKETEVKVDRSDRASRSKSATAKQPRTPPREEMQKNSKSKSPFNSAQRNRQQPQQLEHNPKSGGTVTAQEQETDEQYSASHPFLKSWAIEKDALKVR